MPKAGRKDIADRIRALIKDVEKQYQHEKAAGRKGTENLSMVEDKLYTSLFWLNRKS